MRFELKTVWPVMQSGDPALVDDVDNQSFRDFVRSVDAPPSIVMRSADGPWMFGAIQKDGPADAVAQGLAMREGGVAAQPGSPPIIRRDCRVTPDLATNRQAW